MFSLNGYPSYRFFLNKQSKAGIHMSEERHGSISKDDYEDILINILPSYQMYQSHISRNLVPSADDDRSQPPKYERTSSSSSIGGSTENSSLVDEFPTHFSVCEDGTTFTRWEDSVLANSHKLKRVYKHSTAVQNLDIQIHLTEELGKVGQPLKVIQDPLTVEYHQGDYIYGYVTAKNTSSKNMPFDMFSVVLEGVLALDSVATKDREGEKGSGLCKFLNMFDFNASWNDAMLDRLVTDKVDPHHCFNRLDESDNTYTYLNPGKVFEPGVTYKKFFTFKLPQKLLDIQCVPHRLVKHLQIPPTFGISEYERECKAVDQHKPIEYASVANDFCFKDSSIAYTISARVINRASDIYKKLPTLSKDADEYVVTAEQNCFFRVVPYTNKLFKLNQEMIKQESNLVYKNMIWTIEEKIRQWGEVSKKEVSVNPENDHSTRALPLIPITSPLEPSVGTKAGENAVEVTPTKLLQLYPKVETTSKNMYEVIKNYNKKSIMGHKTIGVLALSTPIKEYNVNYFPSAKYGKPTTNIIEIPLEINFMFTDNKTYTQPPLFHHINVEVIAFTVKSKMGLPIPVVISHEQLFENDSSNLKNDSFETVTIRRFQKYAVKLNSMIKRHGLRKLELEPELLADIKSLANLKCKYDHLYIDGPIPVRAKGNANEPQSRAQPPKSEPNTTNISLLTIPWKTTKDKDEIKYTKQVSLSVDISKVLSRENVKEFCLVPEFQHCYLARLYYLKVYLCCPNGSKLAIKVPLTLQRHTDE